jgi:hypothetical protein
MNILISVTTGGMLRRELSAALVTWSRDPRYTVEIFYQGLRPYENNLNMLAKHATAQGFDWWLQLDDDQCPTRNPLDLIEFDKDVLGCPAPIWKPEVEGKQPLVWNCFLDTPDGFVTHSPKEGLQRVDVTGSGAILIARRVFSVIENPFGCEWSHGLKTAGPDISFCRRARAAGFEIWVHYGYPSHHWQTIDLTELAFWMTKHG